MFMVAILYLFGLAMISYGSFKISEAAGFIVVGIIAVLLSIGFDHVDSNTKSEGDN
jgi:hypothetical protein